jgi:hypothetical protein
MMPDNTICILLTGTIEPKNVPNLKRVDPLEREQDYYYALNKWMKLEYPIVFVENSGYNSEKIDALFAARKDCEYIRFDSQVSYLGKSHGEAEIMKFAFKESKLLRSSNVVIKSSGRQFISNAVRILSTIYEEEFYVISWLKRRLRYADSRFFIARKEFYVNYLLQELMHINEADHIYFEHVLARAVHRCLADGKQWASPKAYPICEGISGTENMQYKTGLYSRLKGELIIKLTNRLLQNDYL